MNENWALIHEIMAKIKQLTPGERLYLVGQIAGQIRNEYFTDHEKLKRQMEEMANDPDIQRVLRGEDLPEIEEAYPRSEFKCDKAPS